MRKVLLPDHIPLKCTTKTFNSYRHTYNSISVKKKKVHQLQSGPFNSVGRNISALVGCIKKLTALYEVQLLEN